MDEEIKQYIGDQVYARVTSWGDIILTTENGCGVTNEIYLEPAVMKNLLEFHNKTKEGR